MRNKIIGIYECPKSSWVSSFPRIIHSPVTREPSFDEVEQPIRLYSRFRRLGWFSFPDHASKIRMTLCRPCVDDILASAIATLSVLSPHLERVGNGAINSILRVTRSPTQSSVVSAKEDREEHTRLTIPGPSV